MAGNFSSMTAAEFAKLAEEIDELLEHRVAKGWTPTTSNRKDGYVIEVHAACLAEN